MSDLKSALWAFAVIVGLIVALLVYLLETNNEMAAGMLISAGTILIFFVINSITGILRDNAEQKRFRDNALENQTLLQRESQGLLTQLRAQNEARKNEPKPEEIVPFEIPTDFFDQIDQ